MYRLIYASESNISLGESGVDIEIGRILSKSKRNNPKRNIGGVLYYGDGHFFQVLEGEEAEVRALYDIIAKDERHKNVRIIYQEPINSTLFGDWSMHLVPSKSQIRMLLSQNGFERFTPFQFPMRLIKELMLLLSQNGEIQTKQGQSGGLFSSLKRLMNRNSAA